jgi:riboflavin synthase
VFTGLIADLGRVRSIARNEQGAVLEVETALAGQLATGDSIAVNGVCLTATRVGEGGFAAEAMHETLRRSSLGALDTGAGVNLELPVRLEDRLGGHIVQGHVDGLGTVAETREDGFARVVRIEPEDPALLRYVVLKGSVAVDGVSLTVSDLADRSLSVSLIPETLARTNLGAAGPGTPVNLEVDVLAKHVERLLSATQSATTVRP